MVISGQILPPPLPPSQESFDDIAPEASRCRWRFVRASLPGLSVVGAEALATWAAAPGAAEADVSWYCFG